MEIRTYHYAYIILCTDFTLYAGYTNNLQRRFQMHLTGKGAKYTRAHKPLTFAYYHAFNTKSEALKHEAMIKKLSRKAKLELIDSDMNQFMPARSLSIGRTKSLESWANQVMDLARDIS